MAPILILAAIGLIPLAIAIFLRVNAAVLFMSLCVGEVLVLFVANDATSYVSAVSPTGNVGNTAVKLALLLLPPVLTTVFMFHSVNGGTKAMLNVLPAIGAGLLLALLLEPLLPAGTRAALHNSQAWNQFASARALVVAIGALFAMMFLWVGRRGKEHSHHKRHH